MTIHNAERRIAKVNRVTKELKRLERGILEEINVQEIWQHTETLAQWVRLSGSPEEAQAFQYIRGVLEKADVDVKGYEFEALVSFPGEASLQVISPAARNIECIAHALAPSTPSEGIEAELVYVGYGGRSAYRDGVDVAGKAVLIDGIGSPVSKQIAEQKGSVAQVFIHDDHLHEICLSPVWGTPTPETANLLWQTPAISIRAADGAYLKEMLKRESVRIQVKAHVWTGWKKIPVLIGEIKGTTESERFVLFSGHVDSWYYGAMDNAAPNAAMMEIGRVLSQHRDKLRRSLRLAFWSGHSHGRYPGSTWYADTFWEDLHKNCVAHVNIDSIGGKGATDLTQTMTMAETWGFAAGVIKELTGQSLKRRRITRMGDQSFWGCGVPSLFTVLSQQPPKPQRERFAQPWDEWGWWWHTPEDTIDKLDRDNLLRDAKVYLLSSMRLCMLPLLPFDYSAVADEFIEALSNWQEGAKGAFDLGRCVTRAEEFKIEVTRLEDAIEHSLQELGSTGGRERSHILELINQTLMKLGRLLIPINYTKVDPFDQDLAMTFPPIPVLERIRELTSQDPESNEFRFLRTRLVREAHKVCHTLDEAAETVREARKQLGSSS